MDYKAEYLSTFDNEVVELATEIVDTILTNNDLEVIDYIKDEDGISVFVHSQSANYGRWVDVWGEDNNVDWNETIFITSSVEDMANKCIQGWCNEDGDCFIWEMFFDTALQYVEDKGDKL